MFLEVILTSDPRIARDLLRLTWDDRVFRDASKHVAAVILLFFLCIGDSVAQDYECRVYARIAVDQQTINNDYSCGFSGSRWSSDSISHYNWCMYGENLRFAVDEADTRADLLSQCGAPAWYGGGGKGDSTSARWPGFATIIREKIVTPE